MNAGVRFDHYRNFLPEQEHAAGQFTTTADCLSGRGRREHLESLCTANRHQLRAHSGRPNRAQGELRPGPGGIPGRRSARTSIRTLKHGTNATCGTISTAISLWQPGEEGRLNSSAGGVTSVLLAENLKDTYTQEVAFWLEREVMANFGVRTGAVWRGERQLAMQFNANRPYSAFNVPVTVQRSRARTASRATPTTARASRRSIWHASTWRFPSLNTYDNVPGEADYYTWEITATKRMSNRWSGLFSFTHTWSEAQEKDYFGQVFRQNDLPITPERSHQHRAGRQGEIHRLVAEAARHL